MIPHNLSQGVHTFGVRVKDNKGDWSLTHTRPFLVQGFGSNASETITQVEYFYDSLKTDRSNLVTANVSPDGSDNITLPLAINLTQGVHTITVRARDNTGKYSLFHTRPFLVLGFGSAPTAISQIEYYLDSDPGFGNGIQVAYSAGSDGKALLNLDLGSVSAGVHTIYVRVKDNAGQWSLTHVRTFVIMPDLGTNNATISRIEYFINGPDPGLGNATSVSYSPVEGRDVTALFDVDITGLTDGAHNFFARAQDSEGRWSPLRSLSFERSNEPCPDCLTRGGLAKLTYLSLVDKSATLQSVNYPVPFLDLQVNNASDTTYYKHAKALSYLEYNDGKAPFDRNSLRFNPGDSITRALVLKVLLEAWNIDETTATGASPFSDVPISHPYFKYIKKAYDVGIVQGSGGLFRPDVACSKADANTMIANMTSIASTTNLTGSGAFTKPSPEQINAGFFVPGQYRPDNLSVGVGTDRGNFNHYTKTSFAVDGVVPLVFAHSYNSYATELPNELYPNFMGRGWTHSFNCYITSTGTGNNARFVVHYPDGKLHFYKVVEGVLVPESIGVYDQVTVSGSPVNLVTITTPSKIVYQFEKLDGQSGNFWLVKSIKDRNENTLTFTNELGINNAARLKSVSDPSGRTLNFVYQTGEPRNYLTEVNLGGVGAFNGRKIQFNYSTSAWDGDGIKDLANYKEYDKNGALKTTSYSYYTLEGSEHLLKTITLPKGNVIDNTYEQRKLRSSRTLNGSTVVQQMNTNWNPAYSANSQGSTSAVSVTAGAVTKTTNYTQNDNGLTTRLQTTGANPMDLKMDYGLSTDPTSVTSIIQNEGTASSTGVRIEYYPTAPYNVKLVKTAKAAGDSITQSYVYNTFNDIESFTNGRGVTTSFEYNGTGNLTRINHPIGAPTTMSRNSKGLITQTTTPANVITSFTYNNYGNLTGTSTANGTSPAITTSATYDALSRVVSKTDARNQTITYDYFANDLLKKMNAPLSYNVSYDYDANDNNTTVTNAKGNATTNVYDTQTDQLVSRSFGGKTESFTYYEDGSLKTFTNGRGNVFNFTYDPSGRLTNDGYSAYAFNEDGTLNTVTHTQGSKTYILDYDYDRLKRLNQTTCDGFAVQYRYDNNNNLDQLTYPDGKTVTYTYDAKDRITNVTDWAGRITTYTYDDDGKVKSYTLPNTTKATYTYDAAGRPTGMSHQKSTNAVLSSYTFVLDQGGNHLEENVIEPFTSLPALTAGTTNYTNNARNETTAAGSNSYAFDANGALTNQAGQAITWDSKDNLLTRNGITYYYDGNETRRAKTGKKYVINELSNSVLAETNEAGGYLYYYVYGPTGLLYRQNASSGAVEYYHYDFRGSTIAMTDASQNIVKQYQYDPYGKVLQQTPAAASDDNPFRYVGQYGVQYETDNLYFMRARYYDPTTGKFLSEDPIWNTNLFAYGGNNPIMNIDPLGLAKLTLEGDVGGSLLSKINGGFTAEWDPNQNYYTLSHSQGIGGGVAVGLDASLMACLKKGGYTESKSGYMVVEVEGELFGFGGSFKIDDKGDIIMTISTPIFKASNEGICIGFSADTGFKYLSATVNQTESTAYSTPKYLRQGVVWARKYFPNAFRAIPTIVGENPY